MVYIQVYIPEKNQTYDFRVSNGLKIYKLKGLIFEAIYDINYDDYVVEKYLFMDFNNKKVLDDQLYISDYSIYDGEKFLLI